MFSSALPDSGTVIGGAITLQGKNISLACFHGINFRSKSWALFTMNDPFISFATEAADVIDESKEYIHLFINKRIGGVEDGGFGEEAGWGMGRREIWRAQLFVSATKDCGGG